MLSPVKWPRPRAIFGPLGANHINPASGEDRDQGDPHQDAHGFAETKIKVAASYSDYERPYGEEKEADRDHRVEEKRLNQIAVREGESRARAAASDAGDIGQDLHHAAGGPVESEAAEDGEGVMQRYSKSA